MNEAMDFDHYGVPLADVAVYLVGVVELIGGLLLVVGLFTRLAALILAVDMVGAIATAGRVDGGSFHLGVAPTLLVAMLFLLWAGSGAFALDGKLDEQRGDGAAVRGLTPSAVEEIAGDGFPHLRRQRERLLVDAFVVAVEHGAVVLVGEALARRARSRTRPRRRGDRSDCRWRPP